MCYAIIKVQYHNDKEPSGLLKVEREVDLPYKLAEVKARPGVKKVTVFYPYYSHELVSEWRTKNYETPNEDSISAGKEEPAQGVTQPGPSEGTQIPV